MRFYFFKNKWGRCIGLSLAALLLLTADSFFTVRLLRRSGNIDLLGLKNLWQELHRV